METPCSNWSFGTVSKWLLLHDAPCPPGTAPKRRPFSLLDYTNTVSRQGGFNVVR